MTRRIVDTDTMCRLLVQRVTDYAIYMLSPDGTVANWNAGAQRAKGYDADEIVGRHFSCFYTPEDRATGLPERGLATARETGRFETEGWRLRKDGTRFWAHVVIDAIHDDDGEFFGFAKITRDCTEKRTAALELEAALDNLDLAMSNMAQGLCLVDADGRVVIANERIHEILVVPGCEPLTGAAMQAVLSETLGEAAAALFVREHLDADLSLYRPVVSEIVSRDRTLSATTRRLATGGWVSTFVDITERRRFEDQIQHLAEHDPLTGLANRATLHQALSRALASEDSGDCAVLYIDLDRFKSINDTCGHAVGDQLLQEVGRRLRRSVRERDLIARLGGDEFALILMETDPDRLAGAARRILDALNQPYLIERFTIRGGASIGIAIAPTDGEPETLLRNADLALYSAKKSGRNRCAFYDVAMGDGAAARLKLEAALRRAIDDDAFALHYQPIVRARTSAVIGFEALLRWRRADGTMISPADFVPVAEEAGLMPEIGAWVLIQACREAMRWPSHLTVAVNVSATQLRSAHFIDTVEWALSESGLPPHRLEIEMTETAVLEDRDLALTLLRQLRALGVRIALDDFGTGYSSLSFVHTFPLTRIKIDRSFVRGLGRDPQSTAIVRAIIGLSRSLGLAVTAEGVETEEQRQFLARERGLDLQGFLFGRPEATARFGVASAIGSRGGRRSCPQAA